MGREAAFDAAVGVAAVRPLAYFGRNHGDNFTFLNPGTTSEYTNSVFCCGLKWSRCRKYI